MNNLFFRVFRDKYLFHKIFSNFKSEFEVFNRYDEIDTYQCGKRNNIMLLIDNIKRDSLHFPMGYRSLLDILSENDDFQIYLFVYQNYKALFHSDKSKSKSLEWHLRNKKPNRDIVKHLRTVVKCNLNLSVIWYIVHKDVEIFKYLIYGSTKEELNSINLDRLNYFPDIETAKYFSNTFPSFNFSNALEFSNLQVIQYFHQMKRDELFGAELMQNKAFQGDLESVKFLHYNRTEGCTINTLDFVASRGNLEMFKFLFENRKEPYTQDSLIQAASIKHWNIVKYIYTNKSKRDPYINSDSIDFDVNNCTKRQKQSVRLSTNDPVKFQETVNVEVTWQAFEQSNIEMLEFLLDNGVLSFRLDSKYKCSTVKSVEFLNEYIGLLFHQDQLARYIDDYAREDNFEMIEYIHKYTNHKLYGVCTTDAMDMAASNNNLDLVKFLHYNRREGCTTDAMDRAACKNNLDLVKFLHHNRTEGCTTNAMDYSGLEVVKFLNENRSEGCTIKALNKPDLSEYIPVIQYLLENRPELKRYNPIEFLPNSSNLEAFKFYFFQIKESHTLEWENLIPFDCPRVLRYLFKEHPKKLEGWSTSRYEQLLTTLVSNGFIKLIELLNLQKYLSIEDSIKLLSNFPTTLAVHLIKKSGVHINEEFLEMLENEGYFHLIQQFQP